MKNFKGRSVFLIFLIATGSSRAWLGPDSPLEGSKESLI